MTGRRLRWILVAALAAPAAWPSAAPAQGAYADLVRSSPTLAAYWRLGDAGGTVAADAEGAAPGTYAGGPELGARDALSADADTAVQFDGVDDEVVAGTAATAVTGTLEGWFFWEGGVALLRDATGTGGWILAFDSGGRVAYRAGGTTVVTALATADVRNAWHHVALTADGTTTRWYLDGRLEHTGPAPGTTTPAMPWHVMRNGTTTQYARGRADEVAVHGAALDAGEVDRHFAAGRDVADATPPATPSGLVASPRLGRVVLDWADAGDADLDGYDVFRATSPGGPFIRVNPSRLRGSAYSDGDVTGGTAYVYAVTASDEANNRSAMSATTAATPPTTADLLRAYTPHLRYEPQETYFADSAAEMTDNFVSGSRQNYLVSGTGARLAAANPADPLANLSLGFLGDPVYADGRAATASDYLDAANTSYQQDAQRMRAAGYGDRAYGRAVASGGRTWLQYWLFSYYNPQNVLGFGVHEGDWEFVQVGLDGDGAPEVTTYAQHSDGERCAWSQVLKYGGAPVVYVALASHASYYSAGVNPRGLYPDDNHRGGGYAVRPALEVVTGTTPFMAWRGRWGASSSSPAAPRRQGKWGDPAGFHAAAAPCTVGAAQAAATASALRAGAGATAPEIDARREGGRVVVRYRLAAAGASTLLLSVAREDAPDALTARRIRRPARSGVATLRLPATGAGPYVVEASAFAPRGARSRVARTRIG